MRKHTPALTTAALLSAALVAAPAAIAQQDRFTDQIERSDLQVQIVDVATLPDSTNGNSSGPARMSVMTADPLGRRFVNDQRGPLYTLDANNNPSLYLNLASTTGTSLTNSTGEQGFQSFAFHPNFATAGTPGFGKFYTMHSSSNTTPTPDFNPGGNTSFHSVLLEWSVNDPTANTYAAGGGTAPREVLRLKQPFSNHNMGLIAFNPTANPSDADFGNLYVASGDGGSGADPQNNGQEADNPYGALLRINPLGNNSTNGQYGIPADNVLANDNDANTLAENYATGLRNPQRFGWDADTGNLFIADIGQNVVEEIDLAVNGGNFGWRDREGSFQHLGPKLAGMIDPVAEYDHTNPFIDPPTTIGNKAITLGEVARGTGIPGLDGHLLAGDFPTGVLLLLDVDAGLTEGAGQDPLSELLPLDADGNPVHLLDLINDTRTDRNLGTVSRADLRYSLGINGEIYILNKHDGTIRQLVAVPEPTTAALALTGAVLVLTRRRRA